MKYVSKAYINEKFQNISWDINYLMSQADGNSISEKAVDDVKYELKNNMFAILKELGIDI